MKWELIPVDPDETRSDRGRCVPRASCVGRSREGGMTVRQDRGSVVLHARWGTKGRERECAITTKQKTDARDQQSPSSPSLWHWGRSSRGANVLCSSLLSSSITASQLLDHPFVHFIFNSTLINPCSSPPSLFFLISAHPFSDYDNHSNDKGPRRLPANLFTILFSQDRQLLSFIPVLVNPFSCYL